MAFDGIARVGAALCPPIHNHPKTDPRGASLSGPLRISYVAARYRARKLIDQVCGLNMRNASLLSARPIIASTSFVAIAEGYRLLPDLITHIRAQIRYALYESHPSRDFSVRVLVSDGANTDTGTTVVAATAPTRFHSIEEQTAAATGAALIASPYDDRVTGRVECDVALSLVADRAVRRVWVEAFAINPITSFALAFEPMHVVVWSEIQD